MSLLTLNYNLPEKQNINQTDSSWTERRKNRKYMWNEKLQVGLCKNKSSRTDRRAPKKWYISEFTDAKRIAKWKKRIKIKIIFPQKSEVCCLENITMYDCSSTIFFDKSRHVWRLFWRGQDRSDWPPGGCVTDYFLRQSALNQQKEKKNIVMIFFLDTTYRKKLLPKYIETLH